MKTETTMADTTQTPWRKVPSVTPGGQTYFYYRRVNGVRQCIVWDRLVCQWDAQEGERTLGYYATMQDAQRAF